MSHNQPPSLHPVRPTAPLSHAPPASAGVAAPPGAPGTQQPAPGMGGAPSGASIAMHPQPPPNPSPVSIGPAPPAPAPRRAAPASPRRPEGIGALQDDNLRTLMLRLDRHCQKLLDRVAPFKLYRWGGLALLLVLFLVRMMIVEGFYIVAYVLFIFILNQFILFLQPKDRAALVAKATASTTDKESATGNGNGGTGNGGAAGGTGNGGTGGGNGGGNGSGGEEMALPTLDTEEFRPFVRRLPEFKFWYSSSYATVLAFCATFFRCFDVPVFWPLLLFYFVLLFVATMRRQWLDMKKLKYVPWDIGTKKVYKSDPKRVSVARSSAAPSVQNVVAASGRAPAPVPTINVTANAAAANAANKQGNGGTGTPPLQPVLT